MKIKKLNASFGTLENRSLELHEGLNVISAPNESGKSTWCAFIRAMLYGIDSSERQKAGRLPDKTRYAPWSGAPMEGSMELSRGGEDITITRRTRIANAPMREFSAVYTGSNIPVDGMNALNAGQTLTGVDREVFRRSAFIEQGSVAVTHSAELEKRISAIVSTGDEECSYTEADSRLRAWQRKRRFNRRGRLPEIEDALAAKQRLISSQDEDMRRRAELQKQLDEKKRECESIENQVTESRKSVRREALSKLQSLRSELNSASERHERADDARDAARAALCGCVIGERKPEEAKPEVEADIEASLKLREAAEKKVSNTAAIVMLVICAALTAAGLLLTEYMLYAFIAAGAALIAAIILFVSAAKQRTDISEAASKRRKLLAKYRAENEDDVRASLDEYMSLYTAFAAAEKAERDSAEKLAAVRRRQEQAESKTLAELDFSGGDSTSAQLTRELAGAKTAVSRLSSEIASLSGRLAATGDPVVLGSEIIELEAERKQLEEEYSAIALAVDTLKAADAEIQSRFSPALGKLAAQYFNRATNGRYDEVTLNRDFSAEVRASGDSVSRASEYLSAGALDLMYLCVRLAVCRLALPETANCPLIIDDALVNLDAERREQVMCLLEDIARERQVILFTCK